MSSERELMDCVRAAELHPVAALDALEGEEHEAYHAHVARCDRCRAELTTFREAAGMLAHTVPLKQPAPALRRRVLAAARAEYANRTELPARRSWLAGWSARKLAPLAAGIILALGGLGWGAYAQSTMVGQEQQMALMKGEMSHLESVLQAHDRAWLALAQKPMTGMELIADGGGQATGRIYLHPNSDVAILVVDHLQPLAENKVYQVWLVDGEHRMSGGMFRVNENGFGWLTVRAPMELAEFEGVGITPEPMGGSPSPTGVRILAGNL